MRVVMLDEQGEWGMDLARPHLTCEGTHLAPDACSHCGKGQEQDLLYEAVVLVSIQWQIRGVLGWLTLDSEILIFL